MTKKDGIFAQAGVAAARPSQPPAGRQAARPVEKSTLLSAADLRGRAERQVLADLPPGPETLAPEACSRLLHELRVHQPELELQNEELRRVEGELQASLLRYFDLYNLAPVGYLTLNAQGMIREANLTAADLLGVARGALVGQPLTHRIFPADQDLFAHFRKQMGESGRPQETDLRLLRDTTPWWANIQAHSTEDGECKITLTDISERKREAAEVRQSAERFRAIFERATFGKSLTRPDGQFIQVNQAFADMLGYPVAELQGLNFAQITHPDDVAASRECIRALLADEQEKYRFEKRYIHKGGAIVWADVGTTLLRDEQGTPLHLITSIVEITARKRAEEGLRTSEEFVRNILESVDVGFVVIDPEFKIISANRAYCQQVKLPLGEILGHHCFAISHHYEQPCALAGEECAAAHTFKTGLPGVAMHTHYDREGQGVYIEAKSFPLKDASGRVMAVIETLNDITEKKKLEGQLRQVQKMEAIGTLAGGIAHDFNNILTSILGFGEIVLAQLPPDSPLREEQGHVVNAGKRAAELVKQILTFSRRAEQQLQPLLSQFVVKEALKMLRSSIPTSIEMRQEIDVNLPPVMADLTQIHQVVMNLCTNAYQAMRETGGVLTVGLKGVEVSAAEARLCADLHPGPYANLTVADTGCGMSRAVQERIFEPYYTTKPKGEGTGLGLSLVHGIVTGLGGAVQVSSEPGQGSTFKIYLPLLVGQTGSRPEAPGEVVPGGQESLLVVDDEAAICALECKLLEGLGYRVTGFSDSEAAMRAFHDNPAGFDLILTDMTMPRLNGDELAKEVLRLRPEMPIILCTGFSELINAKKAKALGIREFLEKPLAKGNLAKAVRRALDGESSG